MIARRLAVAVDDRLGASRFVRTALNKVFPDHWSFMMGEIAIYCLLVLVLTGTFLTFFFEPSLEEVVYDGSYQPLRDVPMSAAYRSTVELSFDVRAGLLVRQIHHWAALLFLASIILHLCRIFFTGAFRKPREINWIVGVVLLLLALANGFTGYSMPDDLLSGTGLRIAYSILLSVPLIGDNLAFLVFGGEFPAESIITRLFVLHILVIPALIGAALAVHMGLLIRQKHTQFTGPGRREGNVVGSRLWPTYAARSVGLLAATVAVLGALGGLAQINPIWLYGPYEPAAVSTAAQPDWYLGWTEGGLRLMPPLRTSLFGYRIPELLLPGVIIPGLTFGLLFAWPFLEARVTGDRATHHLLDRPRDRPVRTALGAATLAFYTVLFAGGGQDLYAQHLDVSIGPVRTTLQVMLLALPPAVGLLTWKWCRDLAADRPPDEAASEGDAPTGPAETEPETSPEPVGAGRRA